MQKLPAITLFMLAVGQNAQKYFPFVVSGLVLAGFVFWQWRKTDRGADQIDRFILSLPLARGYSSETPGGNVFPDAFDAAAGRTAAGAVDGDGGQFDDQPSHSEGCDAGQHESSGRARAGEQSGGTEYFSRPRGGDA